MTIAALMAQLSIPVTANSRFRIRHGRKEVSWREPCAGQPGSWWCVADFASNVIEYGWAPGNERDVRQDIERAQHRIDDRRAA